MTSDSEKRKQGMDKAMAVIIAADPEDLRKFEAQLEASRPEKEKLRERVGRRLYGAKIIELRIIDAVLNLDAASQKKVMKMLSELSA